MSVDFLRPAVGDLVFQLYGRPLHPELFDILAVRKIQREDYELTVRITLTNWPQVEAFLQSQGREVMPEEVLTFYRQHHERFTAYLADCDRLREWAAEVCTQLDAQLGGRADKEDRTYRNSFAALASGRSHAKLLFAMLDGRLDLARLRKMIRDPEEASQALRDLGLM